MELGIYTQLHMAGPSRNRDAMSLLARKLDASRRTLFSPSELTAVFAEIRREWLLPKIFTDVEFLDLALETKTLMKVQVTSTYPLHTARYHRGKFSAYQLALSLRPRSYLSHGTAAFLHGLTHHQPDLIYVNKEQSEKNNSGSLTQPNLDRAFSGKQRLSKFVVTYADTKVMLLNGKDTNRLGVKQITGAEGETIDLTDVERTLIDIAVRPGYAGGVTTVLQSYRSAINKISIQKIAEMLEEIDHLYPYHQAIGFFLERAGQNPESLSALRDLGLKYDFFLAHGMKKTKFDSRWRIHYPNDLEPVT
jgi:predicted transcriptional regulator of viral defense system